MSDYSVQNRNPFQQVRRKQRIVNNVSTVASLTGVGLVAKGATMLANKNPKSVNYLAGKTGAFVTFVSKHTPNVLKNFAKGTLNLFKNYKLGQKVINYLKDFRAGDALKRGKFALKGLGIAAVALAAVNIIKNHFYIKGRIDQQYNDSTALSNLIMKQTEV